MFNVLQWAYDRKLMVQFHPGDIGPVMVILLSDKDCNAVEGYIRPDEPGLLQMELEELEAELKEKIYWKEAVHGCNSANGDA